MHTRRIAELYRQAKGLPAGDRALVLDRECLDDPETRQLLATLLADDVGTPVEAIQALPRHIGPYRIVRRIAEGGMGSVYEAEQPEPRRRVAIKMLRDNEFDENALARLRREAEILARLQHACIAQVYVVGTTEDGAPYLVMELIEGATITEHARDLSERQRVKLIGRVGEAVEYAHRNGIIHRDIKPANVLVTADGDPKLLDFGVAGSAERDGADSAETDLAGTVAYMSPEQVRGEETDTRSDVFALGVLAHEVLTDEHPAPGRNDMELLTALVSGESYPCALRGDLGSIVAKAMHPDPDKRYATAAEFGADLRRYNRREPILARPSSLLYRAQRFAVRHAAPVVIAVGAVFALVVGLLLALRGEEEANRREAQAHLDVAVASFDGRDPKSARMHLARVPKALRKWEWRHLDACTDRSVQNFPRDGSFFATSGEGVVNASAFQEGTLDGPVSGVTIDFDFLARPLTGVESLSVLESNRPAPARLIHGPSGQILFDRPRIVPKYSALRATPLIVAGYTFEVHGSWLEMHSEDGEMRRVGHHGLVYGVAVDAARKRFATGSRDSLIRVGHLATATVDYELAGHRAAVQCVEFDMHGDRIASASIDGTVRIWNLETRNCVEVFTAPVGTTAVAFSPDGGHLYALGVKEIRVWNLRGLAGRARMTPHVSREDGNPYPYIYGVDFAESDGLICTGAWDGTLRLLRADGRGGVRTIKAGGRRVYASRFLGEGNRIIALSADVTAGVGGGHLEVFTRRGERIAAARPPRHVFGRMAVAPNESFVVTVGLYGGIATFAMPDLKRLGSSDDVDLPERVNPAVVISADSTRVIVGTNLGAVRFLDRYSKLRRELRVSKYSITAMATSPDGMQIACGDQSGAVTILDYKTGKIVRRMTGHFVTVYGLAYRPGGDRLASGADDNTIRVWDVKTGDEVIRLNGHESYVFDLAWSNDGEMLASVGGDNTLRLWGGRQRVGEHRGAKR